MTSQPRLQTVAIHVLPKISQIKSNQTMKFNPLIKYNKGKFFFKNHAGNEARRLVPDLFLRLCFATAFLLFFFFFSFPSLFLDRLPKLFSQRFISYQESVCPRSDSFLGHNKKSFLKNCSSSCHSWRVWHMALLMHGNQHS